MTDQVLQQLWEAYSAHEGRKHKRATRGLVTPNDLDRFRTDFNHIINTIKAETWWEACVRIADGESNLDIAHVYQKQNPYLGEPMTDQTPIERAGNALMRNRAYQAGVAFGVPDETEAEAKHRSEIVKAVLDSIDTDRLATVILRSELPGGIKVGHADKIALAVKNWLTGKDQQ